MAKFLVWVNSYNRREMLLKLIHDIEAESGNHTVDLMVINDASKQDYTPIKAHTSLYWRTKFHHGKEHYWKLIKFATGRIKILRGHYDCFVKTDDDMRLVGGFFDLVKDLWDNLDDSKKATLDILSAPKQRGKLLLGNSAEVYESTYKYYRTQWVDMNFVFNPDVIPDEIGPCKATERSSGVGLWLTRYLIQQGYNLYQAPFSLVIHGAHKSQMNREERKRNPVITRERK